MISAWSRNMAITLFPVKPSDLSTPISCVRSITDMSIMFIMPIAATRRDMPAIITRSMLIPPTIWSAVWASCCVLSTLALLPYMSVSVVVSAPTSLTLLAFTTIMLNDCLWSRVSAACSDISTPVFIGIMDTL